MYIFQITFFKFVFKTAQNKFGWYFVTNVIWKDSRGSNYTGRNSIKNNHLKLEGMSSETRQKKKRKYVKGNMLFAVINTVKNIFPVSQKFSLCYSKIPCVFPVWKK